MILITGASGELGKLTVQKLSAFIPTEDIAVLIREQTNSKNFSDLGLHVRIGDYNDYNSLIIAMKGIDTVLLISSNDILNRLKQHQNVIDAARETSVQKIVFISGLLNNAEESVLRRPMDAMFKTEDYIKESGMKYIILRNTLYMENLAKYLGNSAIEKGIFFPAGKGKVAYAQREDLAEATAKILISEKYNNQTFSLTGNQSYSFEDIAKILCDLSGKDITYYNPEPKIFLETLLKNGIPEQLANISLAFATAIKNGDMDYIAPTLEELLGRKPKDVRNYLEKLFM